MRLISGQVKKVAQTVQDFLRVAILIIDSWKSQSAVESSGISREAEMGWETIVNDR